MAAAMEEALGTVCWWGLSPALDLRQHLPPEPGPVVLLVGAAEGRHLLLTAARARRGPPPGITLFVAEQRPESVARQLLFLLLATEAPGRTGPAARAAALLELLGSRRLRAATAAALSGAAARLRRWIGRDPRHRQRGGPADLALMKCRDRDALEAVLRRWERPGPEPGPEPRGWERRLRRRLGTRYEARAAVADWELRMGLHPRGATPVSPAEFGRWRESGVAFVPRGGGEVPNPTLQSGRLPHADGQMGPDAGYWGDTVTGPFLAFGLDTGGLPSPGKTATEISLANVTAMLQELLTGTPPGDPPTHGDRDPPTHGDRAPPTAGDPPEDPPGDQDPPRDPTGDQDRDPPTHGDPPRDPAPLGDPPGDQNRDPRTNGDPPTHGDPPGDQDRDPRTNGDPPTHGDPPGDPDSLRDPPGDWDPCTNGVPPSHGDPPEGPPGDHDPPGDRDPPTHGDRGPPTHGDPPGDQDRDPRTDGDPPEDQGPPYDDPSPLGPLVPLPLRIRFLPLGSARRPPARARLGGSCRLLLLGWRSLQELSPELGELAAPGATLLVELPTFVPTLRQPQLDAFRAQATALARASGFEPWGGPGEPPACARFRRLPQP